MPALPSAIVSAADAALLALRPAIVAELPAEPVADVADFLHRTLRPILKLQNEPLLAIIADFLHDHHIPFRSASVGEQQRLLTELLGRNTKLRYTLIGLVVAMFTTTELHFYRTHRSELNRRLLELAVRRAHDQTAAVAALLPMS
ncbi:hypothetical protein HMJ29_04845 [Hymenobacter taeanensis]|uniref:Uncharacterized protein n=1 Tax=Hymenobacter taeanensis TaxID=2735321 RepID=A0A6M6BE79_9BACT|nr:MULTISPECIES: hypothetical protein [Hymenobacter]QJX46300.1 hypothetical protein HMJ29_04845 [Hymenobacter taeanensis]UOQ80158.1 hypothetical protein MUN83_15130 [Hymenobacter sp. 5414T-23]